MSKKVFVFLLSLAITGQLATQDFVDNGRHSPLIDPSKLPNVHPRPLKERIISCGHGVYAVATPKPRFNMVDALKDNQNPPLQLGLLPCPLYWPPCKDIFL